MDGNICNEILFPSCILETTCKQGRTQLKSPLTWDYTQLCHNSFSYLNRAMMVQWHWSIFLILKWSYNCKRHIIKNYNSWYCRDVDLFFAFDFREHFSDTERSSTYLPSWDLQGKSKKTTTTTQYIRYFLEEELCYSCDKYLEQNKAKWWWHPVAWSPWFCSHSTTSMFYCIVRVNKHSDTSAFVI